MQSGEKTKGEAKMKTGNIYLVTYKQYKNDTAPMSVKVFAHDQKECELKINDSCLLAHTDFFANNDGYIVSIEEIETGII
jgi:hypothetical protein